MGEWIVPFAGRNQSAHHEVNFLWRSDRLYVMDNHRAAMWCWWQHLHESREWQLLHVDYHYDALAKDLFPWLKALPAASCSLPEYLAADYDAGVGGIRPPIVRWDNYLAIFLATHGSRLDRVLSATACVGDTPCHPRLAEISPWKALEQLERIASGDTAGDVSPWLVNLDLDYFTDEDSEGRTLHVFDDAFVDRMGKALTAGLLGRKIRCATVALSPETTGGWATADSLMRVLLASWSEWPELGSCDAAQQAEQPAARRLE